MPYVAGLIDGYQEVDFAPSEMIGQFESQIGQMPLVWATLFDTYSKMDDNVELKTQIFQKSSSLYPEDMILKLSWVDTYHGDEVFSIQGTMNPDENDFASIVSVAHATEEFKEFKLYIGSTFSEYIKESESFNAVNTIGRNANYYTLEPDTEKSALDGQDLYDAIVEFDERPSYLAMFFNKDVQLFQTLLRVSENLNIPLKVELDPTLTPEQMAQIAEDLGAYSHRVEIIANAVLARPNSSETLRGKKKPRYALGTLLAYTMLRNANTNAQGIPPLQNPIAGYNFPLRWPGMEMRSDVKFNEETRVMLAKAKVNIVLLDRFDTGPRFVLSDCLTQYDSKTSVLRLTSSAEISMFIDNRLIQICKRNLLKAKTTFKADALRECQSFLESCATAGLIVESEDLGGKYDISITDRADRPHDAVDLNAGYRPQGAVRAVYLSTSVHK